MGKGSVQVAAPKDPDPSPRVVTQNATEIQQARQKAMRDAAASYGRQSTILSDVSQNNKKNSILGA